MSGFTSDLTCRQSVSPDKFVKVLASRITSGCSLTIVSQADSASDTAQILYSPDKTCIRKERNSSFSSTSRMVFFSFNLFWEKFSEVKARFIEENVPSFSWFLSTGCDRNDEVPGSSSGNFEKDLRMIGKIKMTEIHPFFFEEKTTFPLCNCINLRINNQLATPNELVPVPFLLNRVFF